MNIGNFWTLSIPGQLCSCCPVPLYVPSRWAFVRIHQLVHSHVWLYLSKILLNFLNLKTSWVLVTWPFYWQLVIFKFLDRQMAAMFKPQGLIPFRVVNVKIKIKNYSSWNPVWRCHWFYLLAAGWVLKHGTLLHMRSKYLGCVRKMVPGLSQTLAAEVAIRQPPSQYLLLLGSAHRDT